MDGRASPRLRRAPRRIRAQGQVRPLASHAPYGRADWRWRIRPRRPEPGVRDSRHPSTGRTGDRRAGRVRLDLAGARRRESDLALHDAARGGEVRGRGGGVVAGRWPCGGAPCGRRDAATVRPRDAGWWRSPPTAPCGTADWPRRRRIRSSTPDGDAGAPAGPVPRGRSHASVERGRSSLVSAAASSCSIPGCSPASTRGGRPRWKSRTDGLPPCPQTGQPSNFAAPPTRDERVAGRAAARKASP